MQRLLLVSPSSFLVLLLLDVCLSSVDVGVLLVGFVDELFVGYTVGILFGGTSGLLVGRICELRVGPFVGTDERKKMLN